MRRLLITLILFSTISIVSCTSVVREARVDIEPLPEISAEDLIVINTADLVKKTVSINISSSVKDIEEEMFLLKCFLISELKKNGWKPKVNANDCEKCKEKVSEYLGQTWFPESFVCDPTNPESTAVFNIDINIKNINKVSKAARFLIGVVAGRAEVEIEVIISVNGKERKVSLVKATINAKAPDVKGYTPLVTALKSMGIGNTEQAINEATIQIINLFADTQKKQQ